MKKINFKSFLKFCFPLAILQLLIFTYSFNATTETKTKKYKQQKSWPDLPNDLILGQVTGVGIDTSQHVLLFHRAGRVWTTPFPANTIPSPTILELDGATGKLLKKWGENYFIMPHGLTVDHENNIWVTDVALHQIFKFTHDGTLLLKIGEATISGNDSLHFNMPTDIAVCKDGSFYVSDGYGNSRVVKFSKTGKYLFEWGKKGQGPREFDTPHAIDLDGNGNVFVADRENSRIQKFDTTGKFISEWKNPGGAPLYSLTVQKNTNEVYAVDYLKISDTIIQGSDILFFDARLKLNKRVGRSGSYEGDVCRYHDVAVDKNGNVYVGDILKNSIQKFSR
jgi:DNA-binding beta-propeller fold protein YncE